MRARHVHPDRLVAVEILRLGAQAAVEHVGDVELVARARGPEHRVADPEQERVAEHVGRERARVRGHRGDVARALAEEPLDRGVQEPAVGLRDLEQRVELGVEAREQRGVEQPLHDHRALRIERGDHVDSGVARGEVRNLDRHQTSLEDGGSSYHVPRSRRIRRQSAAQSSGRSPSRASTSLTSGGFTSSSWSTSEASCAPPA